MDIQHSNGVPPMETALDPVQVRVYKWAISHPFVSVSRTADVLGLTESEARRAILRLEEARLMEEYDPEHPGDGVHTECRWRILDPHVAGARVASMEAQMRQAVLRLKETRQRLDELSEFVAAPVAAASSRLPVEVLPHAASVTAVMEEALLTCAREMVSCRPGGARPGDGVEPDPDLELALLERGVRVRVLCGHPARHHPPTRARLDLLAAAGAEIRTSAEPFGVLTGFDRRLGFLPHHALPEGAVRVRDASTLAFLYRVFDQAWELAEPFGGPLDEPAQSELHHVIVRLLSEGARDETIARRLGVSLRTCRRHIADIFRDMGAKSRFQAGYLVGRRGGPTAP
ncbi:LuxR C-terminal-related transcriptional regulator [Streptomyces sp. NPDC086091]|uniref:helix-turn-helix transcriptional regulator n=2 Tax=Streptomyces TaxID=1883 RepID=UPI003666122F